MPDEFLQFLLKIGAHLAFGFFHEFFFLNDIHVGQGRGCGHRMARVSKSVGKVPPLHQYVRNRLGNHRGPHGDISTRQALRQNHQVGLQVPHLTDKPSAQPSKCRNHLVRDEKDLILPR